MPSADAHPETPLVAAHPETPLVAMTIAGSDSGGGAGLQADLKTFAAHRVHGTCAVTAVTAQSTVEVRAVVTMDPRFVATQVLTVTDDMEIAAVKTGMLATPQIVSVVAQLAREGRLPNLVVDPVLVSSTGHPLMDEGGVDTYRKELLPLAAVATPNLREAAVLAGLPVDQLLSVEAMVEVAQALRQLGTGTVVVKGGHLGVAGAEVSPDVVAGPDGVAIVPAQRVATPNDHGTGCSLSAAIAANLALGAPPAEAIAAAKEFVLRGLTGSATWRLGSGHGPIDHFAWSSRRPGGGGSADQRGAGQSPAS